MKISAYGRVSTDSADQANSYENQLSYFNREIEAKGHELYKVYADKGLTGTKLTNRPSFFKMLYDAGIDIKTIQTVRGDMRTKTRHTVYEVSDRVPLFDEIWIKNTSRFARNTLSYELITKLRQKHVNIYFIEQNINSNDLAQDLLLKLMQIFDEQDSKDKSLKVRTGIYESAKHGIIRTSGKLFGYTYSKENNSLSIINSEATIIRKIYELYSNNIGIRRIIECLNKERMYTRSGNSFTKTSISMILKNEKYTGYNNPLKYDTGIVFAKNSYAKIKENYVVEPCNRIEPIIDKDLFDKCSKIRSEKINYKTGKGKYNGITKYGRLLICGECGETYIANADDGKRFYNCKGKKFLKNGCKNKNIYERDLDKYIEHILSSNIEEYFERQKYQIVGMILTIASEKIKMIDADNDNKKQELKMQISKLEKKLEGYYELYGEDSSGRDILKRMIDLTCKEISAKKELLESISKGNDQIRMDLKKLKDALDRIDNQRYSSAPKSPEELLSKIKTITVIEGKLHIRFTIPEELEKIAGVDLWDIKVNENLDLDKARTDLIKFIAN